MKLEVAKAKAAKETQSGRHKQRERHLWSILHLDLDDNIEEVAAVGEVEPATTDHISCWPRRASRS